MTKESKVSVGGRRVGYDAGTGDKYPMMVYRPDTSGPGGVPEGTPVHYAMRIKLDHENAHLKTKAHWIIATVPPRRDGKKRTFVAARKWVTHGYVRYWGFVTWGGERHYGWIDGLHLEKTRHATALVPGSYDAYRRKVKRMMTRAWRYRKQYEGDERNAYPVAALLKTQRDELLLYSNPKESPAYLVDRVPHPRDERTKKKKGGFLLSVRYANDDWILVHRGSGHTWYFVRASYRDLDLNPRHDADARRTQELHGVPPSWA